MTDATDTTERATKNSFFFAFWTKNSFISSHMDKKQFGLFFVPNHAYKTVFCPVLIEKTVFCPTKFKSELSFLDVINANRLYQNSAEPANFCPAAAPKKATQNTRLRSLLVQRAA